MMSNHKHYSRRMGSMEEHLSNIVSNRGRDLWKSPRGTMFRIEALALVAIILSFFLAFFGSCRRWSNRWILQKGILVAQVLSLSLGTYSIGLMQSSPVKSGMYPIWAVSLLTLFGCVDPITTYDIRLDYKGPLSKMIFQLCLYFGYVMLMTVSTISNDVAKLAIVLLSTITFMKGFHRAFAFVPLEQMLYENDNNLVDTNLDALSGDLEKMEHRWIHRVPEYITANYFLTIIDAHISHSFYLQLRKHFLGWDTARQIEENIKAFKGLAQKIDYERALKVVEVELAFLFDSFFTSNQFLHYNQDRACFFWTLASFVGICFLGVVAATIPEAMYSHHNIINSAFAGTAGSSSTGTSVYVNIVGTTTADLIVTLVILVSLALLQLVQLIQCLTSKWARVDIAIKMFELSDNDYISRCSLWVVRLRLFLVASVTYFDKYLWQARVGQDSLAALLQRRTRAQRRKSAMWAACCCSLSTMRFISGSMGLFRCRWRYLRFLEATGVFYLYAMVEALLLSDTANPGGAVSLHDDVKSSIAEFLGRIKSRRIGVEWSDMFVENGLQDWLEYLPYINTRDESEAYAFTRRVMIWHIATCYCEEADKAAGGNKGGGGEANSIREKNRRVAMDLSRYCTYLIVSAPELLHGAASATKEALNHTVGGATELYDTFGDTAMLQVSLLLSSAGFELVAGVYLGKRLRKEEMKTPPTALDLEDLSPCRRKKTQRRRWKEGEQGTGNKEQGTKRSDHWELLALVWVQTLLYAAPYGDVQAHMRRLAQGGEFITHLWALLFHLGIDRWEVAGIDELKSGAATQPETTTTTKEVQVQEVGVSSSSSGSAKLNRSKSMP